jgi:cell wall-associated NlpC family hydrolase
MPVAAYRRFVASIRAVLNPGVLMIGFVVLATVVAVEATMSPSIRRRHTAAVSTAAVTPRPSVLPAGRAATRPHPGGSAGAEPHPVPATPPPSPSSSFAISSAPATPPVPPIVLPTNTITSPVPVPVKAPAPPPSGRDIAVDYALAQLGKPYVWGAAGDGAFDCSGLVMRAWESAGVFLPRTTYEMAKVGHRVSRDDLLPGDLVFNNSFGHVQLYLGDGNIIEAPHSGAVVRIGPLASSANAYVRVSDGL